MKRLIILILVCLTGLNTFSQTNTFPSSGNVGIGTTSPADKLHVVGGNVAASNDGSLTTFVQLWNDNAIIWKYGTGISGLRFGSATDLSATSWSEKMRITDAGNVGIGTTIPSEKLHINGNLKFESGNGIFFADNGEIKSADINHRILFRRTENKLELREYGDLIFSPGATAGTETAKVVMLANGNVGIGTTNPQAKLAVYGDIYSTKVKVTQSGWSDYVFEAGYKLPSLEELEKYIRQNKHLPDIPSLKEVNENGIDLGDNQSLLLKKIEELTLYVIDQNKKIETLSKQLLKQNEKNKRPAKN